MKLNELPFKTMIRSILRSKAMNFGFVILNIYVFFCSNALSGTESLQIDVISPGIFGYSAVATLSYNGPAIDTGLERLRTTYPQFRWTSKLVYDDKITTCTALLENVQDLLSRWYYTQRNESNLNVIVTPGCIDGIYMNQLAAQWDILLITSSASDKSIFDRRLNPTWVTTTPFPPPNEVFCSFLAAFNWTKVYVVLDRDDPTAYYEYAAKRVMSKLIDCGVQYTQNNFTSSDKSASISAILREFNSKSRVLLYFGQPWGLRRILSNAVQFNMTFGEHVFLVPLPWTSQSFGNFTWCIFDKEDQVIREAYKSVILLTLIDEATYTSPIVKNLTSEWELLSENVYNNTALKFELPLPNLVAMQAAMEISGRVANEAIEQLYGTSNLPSGKVLANMVMNRTFDLQVGRLQMTSFGHGSFMVHASYFDWNSGSFKVFLRASLDNHDHFVWSRLADTQWFGGTLLPPDEPRCGFDENRVICSKLERLSYDARNDQICSESVLTDGSYTGWLVYSGRNLAMNRYIRWILATTISAMLVLTVIITAAILRRQRRSAHDSQNVDWWLLRDFVCYSDDV